MWTRHNAVVFYYDEPIIASFDVGHGDYGNKVLFTGENETNAPVTLRLFGGPFIDSDGSDGGPARLKCRYNGDATTDVAATFVAVNQLHCPLCEVSNASGVDRCGAHGTSGAAQYIPLPWLAGGQPKSDVDVSITMNGVEYHSSGSTVLHLYGSPHGLSVIHPKCTMDGFSGVVTDSTLGVLNGGRDCRHNLLSYPGNAEPDGTMKLDPVEVSLADINGTVIKNDMGVGQIPQGHRDPRQGPVLLPVPVHVRAARAHVVQALLLRRVPQRVAPEEAAVSTVQGEGDAAGRGGRRFGRRGGVEVQEDSHGGERIDARVRA